MKDFLLKRWFVVLITVALWLKLYFIQINYFKLDIENGLQGFIHFITPLSAVLLSMGLVIWIFKKYRTLMLNVNYFLMTFILYANVVYYRFYDDFITLPLLFQGENMGDLGGSIAGLIQVSDLYMFLDIIVVILISCLLKHETKTMKRINGFVIVFVAIGIFIVNVMIAQTERPQLLTRTFDREMLVRFIGVHNYHVYDAVLFGRTKMQKAMAEQEDFTILEHEMKQENKILPNNDMTGVAKGKNVIVIALESMQTFAINRHVDGEEITPFLNEFIGESYYFNNFYHQTEQGKTSDAEFILENSLFGLPSGAVFFTHAQNEYHALPEVLTQNGYFTSVMHANNKSFWNRDVIYPELGYQKFYSEPSYEVTDENSVNWGLKDIPFMQQNVELMKDMKQPFYTKILTLTNHYPFTLDEEDKFISEFNSNSGTLNRYVQTARYLDESLKVFVEELKANGLYENSIIVMYGDHYGISRNHDKAMGTFLGLGRNINDIEATQLQRVPFIIHIPGQEGENIEKTSGQIDVKPTLLNLLGIESNKDISFGEDLFAKNEESLAVFRNGDFVTKDYAYVGEVCYNLKWQMEASSDNCEPYEDKATNSLERSDKIIYGDLFRFYDEARKDKEQIIEKEEKEK